MPNQHQPSKENRALVEQLSAYGIPQADIAKLVRVDPKTLRLHYAEELECGATKANAKVAGALFKAATGAGPSAITAAIFWLKTRARWREVTHLEHSGPDGKPAAIRVEFVKPDDAA